MNNVHQRDTNTQTLKLSKMKRNFTLLAFVWASTILGATAQTSDNFNSRPEATLPNVKGHLQGKCWEFDQFNTNAGWTSGIEGDGAMNSTGTATSNTTMGIYTPVLVVVGEMDVKFSYKFTGALAPGERRWINLYLTNGDNSIHQQLDQFEITGVNGTTVYQFNKKFTDLGSGYWKLYINFQGNGTGTTGIAIDEVWSSSNKKYDGGCNMPPVAVNDRINGTPDRKASGNVVANDSDPNGETFFADLITPSPHGQVVLYGDGSFTFTPNPGWTGSSTTFTYQICDVGVAVMCSNEATVTLNFTAGGSLPVALADFKGTYKDNGEVELSWLTTFEANNDRFEVLRSFDGIEWTIAGTVNGAGNSSVKKTYEYTDKPGRQVNKKDVYYQLRQVDKDGRSTVSKILVVRVYNNRTIKSVSVTPNPVKNDINVNIQLNESSYIVMKVLNTAGSELMRKSTKASAGVSTFILDGTSKLRPGLYLLDVTINSKERMVVKLLKE